MFCGGTEPRKNSGKESGTGATYSHSSFEDQRLMAWPLAVSEGADGLGTLVFVGHEQIIQAFMTESLKEPFSVFGQDYMADLDSNGSAACVYRKKCHSEKMATHI